METVVGVFTVHDAALGAGERAREVTGPGSSVRIYLPGDATVVEGDVVKDQASFLRVALGSIALGLVGAGILAASARWTYAGLWLIWSLFVGLMMGAWLTGERVRAHRRMRTKREREGADGHALVTATVTTPGEAEKVTQVFERGGGHVMKG